MNRNDLIKYALIAGGAYLAYWYVNNYGPSGAVNDANGNPIAGAVSYWASWFGGAVATAATSTSTSAVTAPASSTAVTTATPTSTTSMTSAPASTPAPPAGDMATQSQLQEIMSYLTPSDQRTFLNMAPTITYQQAAAMIQNAQACASGQNYNYQSGLCTSPAANPAQVAAATGTSVREGRRVVNGVNGMGQIMPASPYITPATNGVVNPASAGLGDLVPAPPSITPATTGLGNLSQVMRSPWGKLPSTSVN